MAQITAFCWGTGLIQFGVEVPQGAHHIATGPERALRKVISVLAVHGWDRPSLRVGDVAMATTPSEVDEGVKKFKERVAMCLERRQNKAKEASHAQA